MTDIAERLGRLFARMSPPRSMDPTAQLEETRALTRAIERRAPSGEDFDAWWQRFEDRLLERATTRSWPTVAEITTAALATTRSTHAGSGVGGVGSGDDWQEAARRMQLRAWWYDHKPCPAHFVTRERLEAIGLNSWDVGRAMAELANPRNAGAIR